MWYIKELNDQHINYDHLMTYIWLAFQRKHNNQRIAG